MEPFLYWLWWWWGAYYTPGLQKSQDRDCWRRLRAVEHTEGMGWSEALPSKLGIILPQILVWLSRDVAERSVWIWLPAAGAWLSPKLQASLPSWGPN